jgi:hypothetical protein
MATKKTTTTAKKKPAAPKAAKTTTVKKPKAEKSAAPPKARHPRARVLENHTSKEALAKSLAPIVAAAGEDADTVENRLKTASNAQLLRLSKVTATVKQKYGNREKLIAAIGTAEKKSKDKDFLATLEKYSLPQLLDLATAAEKRARA